MTAGVLGQFNPQEAGALIETIAKEEVVSRFRALKDHEIRDKGPGDLVTEADLAVESRLGEALPRLLPGSRIVGEEGVHQQPGLIDLLEGEDPVWLIDPVDGTSNFAAGREPFCVMVALTHRQQTLAAWIYAPLRAEMTEAMRGGGASCNGEPVAVAAPCPVGEMHGAVHLRYLPASVRRRVEPGLSRFASNTELYCAGETYLRLAHGGLDHALFWRAKPWDHAPGELIVREAGGHTAFLDGAAYAPLPPGRTGLIGVAARENWDAVRTALNLHPEDSHPA
ncbi:MAG: inositol monophosphatase family protein [Alphaproteobacteria bacterium]